MANCWLLTYDFLEDQSIRIFSPGASKEDQHELRLCVLEGAGDKFRLFDGDNELYFEGVFLGDPNSQEAFAPLDHCQELYGCVEIQYLKDDEWEVL